jgi:hypothetical protein
LDCNQSHNSQRFSQELTQEIERFQRECGFYVAALGDALSDVITNHVRDASKKTDALSQVDLRRMLQPYINSKKENIIVTVSEAFLLQCLGKKTVEKCRNNLNALWRDHVQRWLAT